MRLKFGSVPTCPGAPTAAYIADAEQDIPMQGHGEHFVNGSAGLTWACALSKMAEDPKNKTLFPHPLVKAFFTGKTTCYIMTGQKHKGVFIFIKYAHDYGKLLDMNDAGLSQRLAKEDPGAFEQEFLLRVPPKKKRKIRTPVARRASSPRKKASRVYGATARALAAGLITPAKAQEMKSSMNAYERQRLASIMSTRK
jgi:hypothetical protein